MKKLTAICLGWSAFIYGCSATTADEDTGPAATARGGNIVPASAVLVPILQRSNTNIVLPPLTLPPAGPSGIELVPGLEVVSETPVSNVPTQFEGNPTCAEAFGEPDVLELKLERRLVDGNYASADGRINLTIDFSKSSLDYTSSGGVIGVIVKGGPYAYAYTANSGTGLSTPDGEQISHVTFCYLP